MDPHPTPFPGKHKAAAMTNPTKKVDKDRTKPSLQPAPPTRPKRVFGTVKNSNIPIEKPLSKPLPAKTCRPWKPSGNACAPKAKEGLQKNPNINFQEPMKIASLEDEQERTPILPNMAVGVGTPYKTAENCSKCRFDKLETSAYWLAQIRIAEASQKHSVSAAFFRLALECHAQPFRSLRSELKHYVARHESISSETLWADMCQVYGVANYQPNLDPCDLNKVDAVLIEDVLNSETVKDECFEIDIIKNPSDVSEKENAEVMNNGVTNVTNDDISKEEFADGKSMLNSKDSPIKNKMGTMKSLGSNLSGQKSKSTRRIAAVSKVSPSSRVVEDAVEKVLEKL